MFRLSGRFSVVAGLLVAILVAVAACSSSSPTPKLKTADEVMTAAADSYTAIKSVHVKAELTGSVKSGDVTYKLDGSNLEGDIDVVNQAAKLSFNLSIPGAGAGELIFVDKTAYVKLAALTQGKYMKFPLSSLSSMAGMGGLALPSMPAALPTGGAAISTELKKQLDEQGIKVELKSGTEKIEGNDAYHLVVTLPLDKLNANTTSKINSASLDVWVYVDPARLARIALSMDGGSQGKFGATLTLKDYDKSVSVKAPPDSEVTAGLGM